MSDKTIKSLAKFIGKTINATTEILEDLDIIDSDGYFTEEGYNYGYTNDEYENVYDSNVLRAVQSKLGTIDWYCDCCNCYMNNQTGFNTVSGYWTCANCGEVNDVSDNNIEWD